MGNAYTELLGKGADFYNASENRNLTREGLHEQELQDKFQRLLSLMSAGQGVQDRYAAGNRILSLRNTGSM